MYRCIDIITDIGEHATSVGFYTNFTLPLFEVIFIDTDDGTIVRVESNSVVDFVNLYEVEGVVFNCIRNHCCIYVIDDFYVLLRDKLKYCGAMKSVPSTARPFSLNPFRFFEQVSMCIFTDKRDERLLSQRGMQTFSKVIYTYAGDGNLLNWLLFNSYNDLVVSAYIMYTGYVKGSHLYVRNEFKEDDFRVFKVTDESFFVKLSLLSANK